MSSSVSLLTKDGGSGIHKKPRKKRNRNKYRINLRKKRTKKFYSPKKQNYFKSNTYNCDINSEKVMSDWYWTNYKKAIEWQDRHKVAHWKACALALMEENRYLLQIINEMNPALVPALSVTRSNLVVNSNVRYSDLNHPGYSINNQSKDACHSGGIDEDNGDDDKGGEYDDETDGDDDDDDVDEDNEDYEFEMSEEMIQFFEQSYRHKMDLQKLKEKELQNKAEEEVKQMQTSKIKRSTEMNLLYGDGASMIIGMETAVQLSFDKYCDTKSPKYWPNIPFRL